MNTSKLVDIAITYAKHRSLTLSTVSTYAANDGKFFVRLSEGAGCTLRKAAMLLQWFSDNWPEDLEWPSDVPRPSPTKAERKAS